MSYNVLIAEPREILRTGLRAIFVEDTRFSAVHETMTVKGTQNFLECNQVDLIVINENMLDDITIFLKKDFVILTAEPNLKSLKLAYKYGARGYLSDNVPAELLRTALYLPDGAFLLEPTIVPWIMAFLSKDMFLVTNDNLFTPREREIVILLRGGSDRLTIAKQLCISDSTLKTHIKNIAKKCREVL